MDNKAAVQSITPTETWQLLQQNPKAVLVDVRSSMEFLFVGHPKKAIHVAWIDEPDWQINPSFAADIYRTVISSIAEESDHSEVVVKNTPVLLICRSGVRSLEAGAVLCQEGFTQVYNVLDGFEGPRDAESHRSTLGGWRFDGLPWEQC
jgi:rhodanese-related sulfurtransferase